jgi:hypothetical protein
MRHFLRAVSVCGRWRPNTNVGRRITMPLRNTRLSAYPRLQKRPFPLMCGRPRSDARSPLCSTCRCRSRAVNGPVVGGVDFGYLAEKTRDVTSESNAATRSEQEWVVVASFDSYRHAEHMLASLGRGFRTKARKGGTTAVVVRGNADGSLKANSVSCADGQWFCGRPDPGLPLMDGRIHGPVFHAERRRGRGPRRSGAGRARRIG